MIQSVSELINERRLREHFEKIFRQTMGLPSAVLSTEDPTLSDALLDPVRQAERQLGEAMFVRKLNLDNRGHGHRSDIDQAKTALTAALSQEGLKERVGSRVTEEFVLGRRYKQDRTRDTADLLAQTVEDLDRQMKSLNPRQFNTRHEPPDGGSKSSGRC